MPSDEIRKIRETRSKDEGDWDDWPYPTVEIESIISGKLRSRILAKLGRPDEDAELHLIETQVSAGWSEFTQEDDCSIEVRIGSEVAWSFGEYGSEYSTESAMARFLKEFGAND